MQEKDATNLISALLPPQQDEPYHVTAAELSAYAHGEADDVTRELVETHAEVCHECAQALEKLRALRFFQGNNGGAMNRCVSGVGDWPGGDCVTRVVGDASALNAGECEW